MEKAEYIEIKKQISFEKPLWITLLVVVADLGLLAVALKLLSVGGFLSFILSQIILAVFYFHNFGLLHEAGHGNIHKKTWVNTLLGHYFSIFCFMPYYSWKYIHQEHHVWTGNIDKDPTMAKIKEFREKKSIPLIHSFFWKSWIPLAAFSQQYVFFAYPIIIWKSGKMTPKIFMQSSFSVFFIISVYVTLAYLFPDTVNFSNFVLSYVLYMALSELVNLPHHVQMPNFHTSPERSKLHPWEQHITTRSCDYGFLSSILALNFNYHIEHHFFPNLPWYRLKKLRSIIKPKLGREYIELKGIAWNIKNRAISAKDVLLPEVSHPLLYNKMD